MQHGQLWKREEGVEADILYMATSCIEPPGVVFEAGQRMSEVVGPPLSEAV